MRRLGHVEDGVDRTLRRFGVRVRVAIAAPTAGIGLGAAGPAFQPFAGVVGVLVLCGLAAGLWFAGRRNAEVGLAVTTVAVTVLVGATQRWTGEPGAQSWVFAVVSISAICAQYELARTPVLAWSTGMLGAVAMVMGTPGGWAAPTVLLALRVLVETGLSRAAYLVIRSRARAADRAHVRTATGRRMARLHAAHRSAEREYLATLHDTASGTLLMVSLGPGEQERAQLARLARVDLERLGELPPSGFGRVDLVELLRQAVDHPTVTMSCRMPDALHLPAGPARAISSGVREAVANVGRHAGVSAATLSVVSREGDGIVVEVADAGRGFDLRRRRGRCRGISGSVVGRMEAVGGRAEIVSAPGSGTRIRWTWHD